MYVIIVDDEKEDQRMNEIYEELIFIIMMYVKILISHQLHSQSSTWDVSKEVGWNKFKSVHLKAWND